MSPEQIKEDETEHRRVLEKTRVVDRYYGGSTVVISERQAARIDAAEARARRKEDDLERPPAPPAYWKRFRDGFAALSRP